MSIKVSGGGGGGAPYPGVTGDGQTPPGVLIEGSLQVGTANNPDSGAATFAQFYGNVAVQDIQSDSDTGNAPVSIQQSVDVMNYGPAGFFGRRHGSIGTHDYSEPFVFLDDTSGSAQPLAQFKKDGIVVLELKTIQSITGALASVTDANAKAVLTSIIAALTSIKVATNNTT